MMGQTILGLDIGAKSIKAVKISSSFKKMEFLGTREILYGEPDQGHTAVGWDDKVAAAVATLLRDPEFNAEVIITAVPGTMVTSRIAELPFAEPRLIDQIIYAELEGTLPFDDLHEVVIDYQIARLTGEGGAHILVAAAHKEQITGFLGNLRQGGVNPRIVSIAGLAQSGLVAQVVRRSPDRAPSQWPVAVADIGREHTTVSIINEESTLLWRSFQFGGENLIGTVARKLNLDRAQAEELIAGLTSINDTGNRDDHQNPHPAGEHTQAPMAPLTPPPLPPLPVVDGEEPPPDPVHGEGENPIREEDGYHQPVTTARLQDAVREALAPLLRNLRQTLMSMDSIYSDDIFELFLTGGVSNLKGLPQFLEEKLSIRVRNLHELYQDMFLIPTEGKKGSRRAAPQVQLPCPTGPEDLADWSALFANEEATRPIPLEDQLIDPRFAEALALTMRQMAIPGNPPRIDLRKGELGYKGDFQYLRGKILSISVALIAILAGLGLLAGSKFTLLRSEETALLAELKAKSELVFGQELTDFGGAARMVTVTPNQKNRFNIPTVSAYDMFYEISSRIGDDMEVDLEMVEIDLERNKVEIRGRTDSATSVETISDRLQGYQCFKKISRDRNEKGTDGKQLFVLSIDTEC